MNKINVLFLSSLILVGPSAYGMRQSLRQAWTDFRQGFKSATTDVRDAGNNLPNRMYANAQEERQGMNDDIKGFKKEIDNGIGDLFESSEALFGKKQYNTYINKLNGLKERAKTAVRNTDFDFDADAEFQDLIDQEAAAIEKQQRKQQYRQQPAVTTVRGKRVRQPQSVQQRIAPAVMPNHVLNLQRDIDAFDRALNDQVNIRPQPQRNNVRGRNAAPVVVNQRSAVTQARKRLNATIDSFKSALEVQLEQECEKSPLNEAVYGGSSLRSWATMGALALGALFLGESIKDSETGQRVSGWFAQGGETIKTAFTNAFNWIAAKFA